MNPPTLIESGRSEAGWSRIGTAAKCLRRFAFDQEARKANSETPASEAQIKGTLLHLGLAHWYALRGVEQHGHVEAGAGTYDKKHPPLPAADAVELFAVRNGWEGHLPTIHACLQEYISTHSDRDWEILSVEKELRFRLPNEKRSLYTQRADLVVKEKSSGRTLIVDHKTTFAIISKTARQFILHGQFLGYQAIGRKVWGSSFGGVLLNRIKLSPPAFDRTMVEPAPAAVKDFVANLCRLEAAVAQHEGQPPERWPAAYHEEVCYSKYGECPWLQRCRWGK